MRLDDCELCPRLCHVNREAGQTGFCGQGAEISVSRVSLHQWEEPCISGVNGSGTVFFDGCPLGCIICQNAEISGQTARGAELNPDDLAGYFFLLESRGAHNINLVTPTHFWPGIADAIRIAKSHGLRLPIVCNTSGYERVEILKDLEGLIDIYLPDCKFYSPEIARRIAGASDYFDRAMEAITEMVRQTGEPMFKDSSGRILNAAEYNALSEAAGEELDYSGPLMIKGTIVRHLLLPDGLDDSRRVVSELLRRFGADIYLSLMSQYTPMPRVVFDPVLRERVSARDYEALVDFALERGLENGFFQGGGVDDVSFIPSFSREGEGNLVDCEYRETD